MDWLDALILGVVEGLTEFLPISSTGHLILVSEWLNVLENEGIAAFNIIIQLGAILAVVYLYRHRFAMLFQKGEPGQFAGLRGWALLGITSFPASLVGLLTSDLIEQYLFNPTTVSLALGIGGLIIIAVEQIKLPQRSHVMDQITVGQALFIGLFQCFALWPGVSRSASTIIGGLFSGLERRLAAEYSFIAAVPIMCMATAYEVVKYRHVFNTDQWLLILLGFVVAFISAMVAVKGFIHLLQRWTLVPFGIYRIIIALIFFLFIQHL